MCVESTAIISAAAVLAGVAITQAFSLFQSASERKHQRRVLLRGKYEELAQCLADSVDEHTSFLTASTNEELLRGTRPKNAQRIYILAQLYFPQLRSPAHEFLAALVQFRNELASNYNPQGHGSLGVQGAASQKVHAAQAQLEQAKYQLDTAIEKHAFAYTAA